MSRPPLYLRPASYRRRRRRDAARLLPFVGGFLVLLPMLWAPDMGEIRATAHDGIYLFGVWAAMILLAFAISRSLRGGDGSEDDTDAGAASDPPPPRSG